MSFPEHLLYTAEHVWVKNMDDNSVLTGITYFAQQQLGKVVFVDLPAVGKRVEAGREMGAVESAKSVSDLFAPLSGVVVAVNEQAEDAPTLINEDPYGHGWLVRINPDKATGELLSAEQYRQLVEK